MKPVGREFAVYFWYASRHPSESLRRAAECSSQILSYRWKSWDALVTISCSATVSFFGIFVM